mgnify:CR=1 FL=1
MSGQINSTPDLFQSTHPRGVRQTRGVPVLASVIISIHAPARGATIIEKVKEVVNDNFNPRTREGCDLDKLSCFLLDLCISIHAPARGATYDVAQQNLYYHLFQSTHPRGVRRHGGRQGIYIRYFNPRTREGCDTKIKSVLLRFLHFNPRTREGCDNFNWHPRLG